MKKKKKILHDDDEYCDDDEIIEWYDAYLKRKVHKAKIKRRALTHCLVFQSCNGLVHVRRREKAVEVTDSCF